MTRSGIVQSPLVPASFHDVPLPQYVYRMRVLYVPGVRTVVAEPAVRRFSGLRPQDREAIDAFLLLPAERRKLVRELIAALAT